MRVLDTKPLALLILSAVLMDLSTLDKSLIFVPLLVIYFYMLKLWVSYTPLYLLKGKNVNIYIEHIVAAAMVSIIALTLIPSLIISDATPLQKTLFGGIALVVACYIIVDSFQDILYEKNIRETAFEYMINIFKNLNETPYNLINSMENYGWYYGVIEIPSFSVSAYGALPTELKFVLSSLYPDSEVEILTEIKDEIIELTIKIS